MASKVESGEERRETKDRVDEERRHQTEVLSLSFAVLFFLVKETRTDISLSIGVHRAHHEGSETYDA